MPVNVNSLGGAPYKLPSGETWYIIIYLNTVSGGAGPQTGDTMQVQAPMSVVFLGSPTIVDNQSLPGCLLTVGV